MVPADSRSGVAAASPCQLVPFVVKQGLATQAHQAGFPDVTQVDPVRQENLPALRVSSVIEGQGQAVFSAVIPCGRRNWISWRNRTPQTDLALVPGYGLAIRPAFNPEVVMTVELAVMLRAHVTAPIHHRFTAGSGQEDRHTPECVPAGWAQVGAGICGLLGAGMLIASFAVNTGPPAGDTGAQLTAFEQQHFDAILRGAWPLTGTR